MHTLLTKHFLQRNCSPTETSGSQNSPPPSELMRPTDKHKPKGIPTGPILIF